MDFYKCILIFFLLPVMIFASFEGGGSILFMQMGNMIISDNASNCDISQLSIYYGSIYGKFNLNNFAIYGKFNIIPYSDSDNLSVEKLYGTVDLGYAEMTVGKQYFNTGYGKIFKINNLMGNIYSPFNIFETNGKTGVSIMYYPNTNIYNFRGGMFINHIPSKFSDNTYVLEEELNIDRYGFKLGQFYLFDNIAKYLFSLSFNTDIVCGINLEFQTFSDSIKKSSFSYRTSVSIDYTVPIGNGIYMDVEGLYKKNKNFPTFSSINSSGFYDIGNKLLAVQVSYPFNLIFKFSFYGLYNCDEKIYSIAGTTTIGKQIFYTDLIMGYNKYPYLMSEEAKGNASVAVVFRLSI